ncbi:MAG: excinuclease ABC subunit UvrC [Candidatus Sericytochromatia bacterium]|nr:excinuclease ABC subunit UvrC [Candidatus Sericytochromatia bacterium]
MHDILAAQLAELPVRPGCYLFRDASGLLLYIGKAVNLRQRVRSYFREDASQSAKTRVLASRVHSVEVVQTPTPEDALNLENTLIKEHQPFFNIRLRDDATYPWLKLTLAEDYPRLLVVRRRHADGSRYFGPFPDAGAMRATLHLAGRLFPLRKKGKPPFRDRPCLNFDIGRCLAPCQGMVDRATYRKMVLGVQEFLEGRSTDLEARLEQEMAEAAERLDFEQAARLRDTLSALRRVTVRQVVVGPTDQDLDAIQVAVGRDMACVEVLQVRGGRVIGRREHGVDLPGEGEPGDATLTASILSAFLAQGYEGMALPPEILVPVLPEDVETLGGLLSSIRGSRVRLAVPQRGARVSLLDMAADNARTGLERLALARRVAAANDRGEALAALAGVLGLDTPTRHIEGFDLSHTQGTEAVASLVVFRDGHPRTDQYRHFRIRRARGGDDFAGMEEVVGRRYRRVLDEEGDLPDVILIDGGPAQLAAAVRALEGLGLGEQPIFGLAKRLEAIFLPGQETPVLLPADAPARLLIQHVRDEAHRFALGLHRKRRARAGTRSVLEGIEGLGPRRRTQLLERLGSVEAMRSMAPAELARRGGIPRQLAERVSARLGERHSGGPADA